MSAICGIYYADSRPVPSGVLEGMLRAISHRGPDGSGTWSDGQVAFGHQMLHTTPESLNEVLPFHDPSLDTVITADARIDNREDLFRALDVPQHEREKMPDSTLILRAYQEWGEGCPRRLLGDFAFVIWDAKRGQIFCARDHMGLRALYYCLSPRFFAFASEIKGVLAVPGVPLRLNEIAIADFLVYNEHDLEVTPYKGISRLPPAHYLVIKGGNPLLRKYWAPKLGPELRLGSDEEYARALREKIVEAVRCRIRTPYPVAVMLSGGLDSSSIACIAARRLKEKGTELIAVSSALSESHRGVERDEREYIDEVKRQEDNVRVEYVLSKGATPFQDLEAQFRRLDQPFRDLFYYMSDALYGKARSYGVRILLSGFGGDMAASYNGKGYIAELFRKGRWLKMLQVLRSRAKVEDRSFMSLFRGQVLGSVLPPVAQKMYHSLMGNGNSSDILSHSAIHPDFARRVDIKNRCRHYGHDINFPTKPDTRAMMLKAVSSSNLAFPLEGMGTSQAAFGIEQALPLLDKRIVDFCLTVPANQFLKNGWRRSLMRRAMEGILPPKIQWRTTKEPFSPDYHARMLRERDWILRFLSGSRPEEDGRVFVDIDKIERQLMKLRPVKGWDQWENDTPIIVGKGVVAEGFVRWFGTNRMESIQ